MANPWDQYTNQYTNPQAPSGPYADLVPAAAAQYGIPTPVMNWVGYREGGWKNDATGIPTSTGRAQGNWQFMPSTAQDMGVDPNDPESSTFGAAKYLRSLYDQTGSWTEAVRKYGTFSSGKGANTDRALEAGFMTHMLNNGLDPDKAPPTGPVQVGDHATFQAQQGQDPTDASGLQAAFQTQNKATPMPDPTSASAMVQQTPGNAGILSPMNLLRMAAGFAGKKTFGQGLSAAMSGAADGMMQDQQMAMLQQQRAEAQQRLAIENRQADAQQQQADTASANGRAAVIGQAGQLIKMGVPPQQALQVALAAYQGPKGAPGASGATPGPASPSGAPAASPGPATGTGGPVSATPLPPITGAGPGTPQPLPPGLATPASSPPGSGGGAGSGGSSLPPGLAGPSLPRGLASPSAPPSQTGPQWPGMPSLSNVPYSGGPTTAGGIFYSPDGTAWQERNRPYGSPLYFNTNTGQMAQTLPQGALRAEDSGVRQRSQADVAAEMQAQKDAIGSQQNLATLNTYQGLIPQIASGNDIFSTIKRNAATLTGMPIGETDPGAIQLAQQAQQTLANARMMMLGHAGLGRVNVQEVNAVKNAGAGWAQNPQSLNIVLNYQKQQEQMKQDLWDQWAQAPDGTKAKGFQSFQYNFLKDNKTPQMNTSSVTGQPDTGTTSAPAALPSAAPSSGTAAPATPSRPPLSQFGFKGGF